MLDTFFELLMFWFLFIGVLSVLITVYDKSNAIKRKHRVPEKTLLMLGFIGGAPAMFATMLFIRHKTRHLKFMLFLPLFMLVQIALLFFVYLYL